jgi:phytoene synthase
VVAAHDRTVSPSDEAIARGYRICGALARSHYENFPVASRLVPAPMRPHIAAVYAFARLADDMADEGTDTPERRQAGLRDWQDRMHRAAEGVADATGQRDDLILAALGHTIRSCKLPLSLFDDLLSAFGQDTTTNRYASWADLLDYCRRSANPVGRLVLLIGGYRNEDLARSSDGLCTALQLTNFWQDIGRDWRAGRLYVPLDVVESAGALLDDLRADRWTPAWRAALAAAIDETRRQFDRGRDVCDGVRGRLACELRLTWVGGQSILQRAGDPRRNPLHDRPSLRPGDIPRLLWRAARWDRGAA